MFQNMFSGHLKKIATVLTKKTRKEPKQRRRKVIKWHLENRQLFGPISRRAKLNCDEPVNSTTDLRTNRLVSEVMGYDRVREYLTHTVFKERQRKSKTLLENNTKSDMSLGNANDPIELTTGLPDNDMASKRLKRTSVDISELSDVAKFLIANQQCVRKADKSLKDFANMELLHIPTEWVSTTCDSRAEKVSDINMQLRSAENIAEKTLNNGINRYLRGYGLNTEDSNAKMFPLYKLWKDEAEEEVLQHLKSIIQKKFDISKYPVSSAYILEKTSSGLNTVNQGNSSFNSKDAAIIQNSLYPYLMNCDQKSRVEFPTPTLPPHLVGYWRSIKAVLKNLSKVERIDVEATHPVLGYTVTADLICYSNDKLILMDWKSQLRISSLSSVDRPLQVVACLGALNFDPKIKLQKPLMLAALIVGFKSGIPGLVLHMKESSIRSYWFQWMERWQNYQQQRNLEEQ